MECFGQQVVQYDGYCQAVEKWREQCFAVFSSLFGSIVVCCPFVPAGFQMLSQYWQYYWESMSLIFSRILVIFLILRLLFILSLASIFCSFLRFKLQNILSVPCYHIVASLFQYSAQWYNYTTIDPQRYAIESMNFGLHLVCVKRDHFQIENYSLSIGLSCSSNAQWIFAGTYWNYFYCEWILGETYVNLWFCTWVFIPSFSLLYLC